jgi:hypothetical protein
VHKIRGPACGGILITPSTRFTSSGNIIVDLVGAISHYRQYNPLDAVPVA